MIRPPELSEPEQDMLVETARRAVHRGLVHRRFIPPVVDATDSDHPRLLAPGASFVTLRRDEQLLGCIGTLEPVRPLIADVAENAYRAAFADPRLPAVTPSDYEEMSVKVSVLSSLEALEVADRGALLAELRPRVDGLLVVAGHRRGTFLPSVWEQIGDREWFLDLLWQKAGLLPGEWPRDLRVFRYETLEFAD
jgi:AmmeMemoRadiSam system protein A